MNLQRFQQMVQQDPTITNPARAMELLDQACECVISRPELYPQLLGVPGWGILERAGFVALRMVNFAQSALVDSTIQLTGQASLTNWAQDANMAQYLQADGDFLFVAKRCRVWVGTPQTSPPPEDVINDIGGIAARFRINHTPSGGQPYIMRPLGQVRTFGWVEGAAQVAAVDLGTVRLDSEKLSDWWEYPIPRRYNPKNDAVWSYFIPATSVVGYTVAVEWEGLGINVNALDPSMQTISGQALRNALMQVMLEEYGAIGIAAILRQVAQQAKS